jgi:hypothetical protein
VAQPPARADAVVVEMDLMRGILPCLPRSRHDGRVQGMNGTFKA